MGTLPGLGGWVVVWAEGRVVDAVVVWGDAGVDGGEGVVRGGDAAEGVVAERLGKGRQRVREVGGHGGGKKGGSGEMGGERQHIAHHKVSHVLVPYIFPALYLWQYSTYHPQLHIRSRSPVPLLPTQSPFFTSPVSAFFGR